MDRYGADERLADGLAFIHPKRAQVAESIANDPFGVRWLGGRRRS